jgi:hypothetical protein
MTTSGKKSRATKAPRNSAAAKSPVKAVPAKPAAPPEPPASKIGEVLGEIPTELRVRMKGLTEAINDKRGAMGNLAFQHTDLTLRIAEIEKQQAEHFRTAAALNREMDECRQQIGNHVEMVNGTNYHVDLTTGAIHAIKG